MEVFVPRCYKKNLLAIAGMVWIIAGTMVSKLGIEVFLNEDKYILISLIIGTIVFFIFFNLIFEKMVKKHRNRILSKEKDKLCVFSFFDAKSYIIMIFMMGLGVTIRSIPSISPICWAPVYIGIGSALFLAGVSFVIEWVKWKQN